MDRKNLSIEELLVEGVIRAIRKDNSEPSGKDVKHENQI